MSDIEDILRGRSHRTPPPPRTMHLVVSERAEPSTSELININGVRVPLESIVDNARSVRENPVSTPAERAMAHTLIVVTQALLTERRARRA